MSDIYDLITKRMDLLTREKEVFADNILRSSVPGEREKVIKFKNLVTHGGATPKAQATGLKSTNKNHLSLSTHLGSTRMTTKKTDSDVSLSGNTINAEEQLRKINDATTKYYEMTSLYQSYMRRHNTVITGR